jgi:hypothetical protein
MSVPLRLAGLASLPNGGRVTWTVADGQRGRRWRTMTERDGRIVSSALLEVDAHGRFAKLELATVAGLLTLHPEEGHLHGNAVTGDGVRHLTFDWTPEHTLEVERLAVASAITAVRLARTTAVGEGRTVPGVAVSLDLGVTEGEYRYLRVAESTWRIDAAGGSLHVELDERGLPASGTGAAEWPLEVHPHP